ncbi:MAG: hypothetical protein IKR42_07840 [Campylobacter sp.]|nr:hypothetical protein [Campylobacter sp.]
MKRANEIREQLNAAIESGNAEQMFNFAQKCKCALKHHPSATRANALRHAIDCVREKLGAQWLVVEPQWCGARKHLRLVEVLRLNPLTGTPFFGIFSAKKFVKELNEKKRAGSATHAYVVSVAAYLAYASIGKAVAKHIYTGF